MTDETNANQPFGEILVAVDASVHSMAGLEAAVTLAQSIGANVKGLFVRSTEWYNLCRLSFISEVSELTGEIRPLKKKEMEKQIKLTEKRIQHIVRFAGEYSRISHSWKSVTGSVAEQVLKAAEEADLITLGRMGHSFSRHKQLGKSAQAIINNSDKPVLIMQQGTSIGNAIIAVYDDTEQSKHGLETALTLAEKMQCSLSVVVLGNSSESLDEREKAVKNFLEGTDLLVDVIFMRQPHVWDFAYAVNRFPKGILIIPKNQPLADTHSLDTLLELVPLPLLLVYQGV